MWHVDDSELHAYLDGELEVVAGAARSTAIEAHLAICEACSTRLEQARRYRSAARSLLRAADPRSRGTPPFEEIVRCAHGADTAPVRPWWRTPRVLAWAASVTLAVGAGWFARAALAPRTADLARVPTIQEHAEAAVSGAGARTVIAPALDTVAGTHSEALSSLDGTAHTDSPDRSGGVIGPTQVVAVSPSDDLVAPPLVAPDVDGIVEPRLQIARSIQTPVAVADVASAPDAVTALSSRAVQAYADAAATLPRRPSAVLPPSAIERNRAAPALGHTGAAEPFQPNARDASEQVESTEMKHFLGRIVAAVADAIADRGGSRSSDVPEPPESSPPAVRGVVLEEGSHAALVGTRVLLIARDGKAVRTAVADLEGAFIFENVEPGTYHVAADRTGYEPRPRRIVVEEHGDVVVELHMRPIPPVGDPGPDTPGGEPRS